MELPKERVSSTPSPRHVPRAVAGTGGYRHRSNTKFLEWWHDIEQRRPLVNRSTRSRDISFSKASWGRVGSGRVGSGRVGSGWAAHTEISPLNYRRTRSALRAPLVIIDQLDCKLEHRWMNCRPRAFTRARGLAFLQIVTNHDSCEAVFTRKPLWR